MRIAITGSTGLIGTALVEKLRSLDHDVVRVVRSDPEPGDLTWDPPAGTIHGDLSGVDAVVHLAGAGIGDHRWTEEYRRTIRESRTRGTNLIAEAVAAAANGPRVLLSASGINFYGSRGDQLLDESVGRGDGFLADVCVEWEASTRIAEAAGVRVAHLRSGVVLSPEGGALRKQLPLFKLGVGGPFGFGSQWLSWITLPDEVSAIIHLLTSDVSGPVNLAAPAPVTSKEFARTLGRVLKRPAIVPVPKFGPALLLGGEAADELLFSSVRAVPAVLEADGFVFEHPDLEDALRSLLDR